MTRPKLTMTIFMIGVICMIPTAVTMVYATINEIGAYGGWGILLLVIGVLTAFGMLISEDAIR